MIALLHVQSSTRIFFHNVILFIDTSNNAKYQPPLSLIRTLHLVIISSNVNKGNKRKEVAGRNTNFVLLVILEKNSTNYIDYMLSPFPPRISRSTTRILSNITQHGLNCLNMSVKAYVVFSYSVGDPSSDFSIFSILVGIFEEI